jgi:hypothetical protein
MGCGYGCEELNDNTWEEIGLIGEYCSSERTAENTKDLENT